MTYIKKNIINTDKYILVLYMCDNMGIYSFKSVLYSCDSIVDKAETTGITDDRQKAAYIYNLLVSKKVFPCHLFYVIDEAIV